MTEKLTNAEIRSDWEVDEETVLRNGCGPYLEEWETLHSRVGILLNRLEALVPIGINDALWDNLVDGMITKKLELEASEAKLKAIDGVTQYGINLKKGKVIITHDPVGGWVKMPEIQNMIRGHDDDD